MTTTTTTEEQQQPSPAPALPQAIAEAARQLAEELRSPQPGQTTESEGGEAE